MSLDYGTCDKPGFNGTFKRGLEGEYTMWAEENIVGRNKKVVLVTLIATPTGTVMSFGPRQGMGCGVCACFVQHPVPRP